jgi:beta-lactamase superfamily II metal-dependent hydrolase
MATIMYSGYPTAKVYKNKGDKKNIHELLWGDWVKVTGAKSGGWYPVRVRGVSGWMKAGDLGKERLLEIVFVDVGQGDGSLIVTPKDKHMVVDAGISDNMYRFLRWRYGGFKNKWTFESAVITHPDQDHYAGFDKLLDESNVVFENIFHNGIIEAKGKDKASLGKTTDIDGIRYITEVMDDKTALRKFLSNKARWSRKKYPTLLNNALTNNRVDNIEMLSTSHGDNGYMLGYTVDKDLSIQVIGPVAETDDGNRTLLRWFKRFDKGSFNKGQTKNGHSVVLRLKYRDISILLGGDLNWAAERFLLENHVNRSVPDTNASPADKNAFTFLAQEKLESDVVKCCHHGSADFMNMFLKATNPIATVISSGDEESHAHPRSDTLGAVGKFGRGDRPLILSTELARSTREKESPKLQKELVKLQKDLLKASTQVEKNSLKKKLDAVTEEVLKRNVTVYGAINLRTDGHKIVMAQRLEQDRNTGSSLQKWDTYKLEPDEEGKLRYRSGSH